MYMYTSLSLYIYIRNDIIIKKALNRLRYTNYIALANAIALVTMPIDGLSAIVY